MTITFKQINQKIVFLFLVFSFISGFVAAQGALNASNLSTFKAGSLTDAEIIQIQKELANNNMTFDQASKLAIAKGAPAAEMEALKGRLQSAPAPIETATIDPTVQAEIAPIVEATKAVTKDLTLFGSELFNSPNLGFEPNTNIPASPNYVLGINDVLELNVWGVQQFSYSGKISNRGIVSVPNVGEIFVSGLTLDAAETKIRTAVARIYSTVGSGSKFSLNVSSFRTISITIIGARQPGNYKVSSMSTVFNALHVAGGPSDIGSYRNIEVIRNDKVIRVVDLYKFLARGDQSDNISLKDNDVIRIPAYKARISLEGEVKRPGIFELAAGENLERILEYAGWFTENAYINRIAIEQKTGKERKVADLTESTYAAYIPQAGDVIAVAKILDRYENRVQIRGAVFRPGTYSIESNMTVKSLIEKANGVVENVFLERATLIREQADLTKTYLTINLKAALSGDQTQNTLLQKEDELVVYFNYDLLDKDSITIAGEIRKPGVYTFVQNITLQDIIMEAEGLTDLAAKKIEIARVRKDSLYDANDPNRIIHFNLVYDPASNTEAATFKLEPEDNVIVRRIEVYETQQQVSVSGTVLYPGPYSLITKDERVSDLLARTGGFTKEANLSQVYLVREGFSIPITWKKVGEKPTRRSNLILKPGDQLVVPNFETTVTISGSVLYPTIVPVEGNKGVRFYLNAAGGETVNADLKRVYVINQNGRVVSTKQFLFFRNYPELAGGSKVIVPEKAEKKVKEKKDGSMIIGYSTVLASISSIIITILKN
jgi:protein involved in polysaccharide export with SLBB domain